MFFFKNPLVVEVQSNLGGDLEKQLFLLLFYLIRGTSSSEGGQGEIKSFSLLWGFWHTFQKPLILFLLVGEEGATPLLYFFLFLQHFFFFSSFLAQKLKKKRDNIYYNPLQ